MLQIHYRATAIIIWGQLLYFQLEYSVMANHELSKENTTIYAHCKFSEIQLMTF
jgi:hypothetical protein